MQLGGVERGAAGKVEGGGAGGVWWGGGSWKTVGRVLIGPGGVEGQRLERFGGARRGGRWSGWEVWCGSKGWNAGRLEEFDRSLRGIRSAVGKF